jgi:hypothetical protein
MVRTQFTTLGLQSIEPLLANELEGPRIAADHDAIKRRLTDIMEETRHIRECLIAAVNLPGNIPRITGGRKSVSPEALEIDAVAAGLIKEAGGNAGKDDFANARYTQTEHVIFEGGVGAGMIFIDGRGAECGRDIIIESGDGRKFFPVDRTGIQRQQNLPCEMGQHRKLL